MLHSNSWVVSQSVNVITESNQLSHFDVADQATLFVFACFGEDSKTRDKWHRFKVVFNH